MHGKARLSCWAVASSVSQFPGRALFSLFHISLNFARGSLIAGCFILPSLSLSHFRGPVPIQGRLPSISSFRFFILASHIRNTLPVMNTTLLGPIQVAKTTSTITKSFPFTIPTASPTTNYTNPLDPPQRANPSQTVLTVIIIVSCIGLLGFGIGYLRVRQMRRINHSSSASTLPPPSSQSSTARNHDLEQAVGMDTVSPPIYAGPSSITTLESSSPVVNLPHCHFTEAPPPYQAGP